MNFRLINWPRYRIKILRSVAECLKLSTLLESVSDTARLDVELLLAHALKKDRAWLYTWPKKEIDQETLKFFETLFERRQDGEPIAYIIGEKAFWSLDLLVNNTTLIPRPETELLVELALEKLPQGKVNVLDLGCGTGAIALAIAKERPEALVFGVDLVPEAVVLAKENAKRNNLDNVKFLQSNWFSNIPKEKYDLIVSNPPYIDASDSHLNQGDVRFEPHSALISPDEGYADLKTIIQQAQMYLKEGAWLLVEHGWHQAERVRTIFSENRYNNTATAKDLAGNERVSFGKLHSN